MLSEEKKNWRLYFNRREEQSEGSEGEVKTQYVAEYIPQIWQNDMISQEKPDVTLFIPLLIELGMTESEAEEVLQGD